MKRTFTSAFASLIIAGCSFASLSAQAQVFGPVSNLRPYDKAGINVFEDPKQDSVDFEGIRVKLGAGFTQSFQALKHSNNAGNLYKITPGLNTANANLFLDVQLADGIRLNLTSYLSSRHHNETWVKGGYIQFDKLPFKGDIWEDIMEYTTIKVGHMEINYGDQHFRRSDGGHTFYNPFAENYILDAFSTEIGGEVLVRKNGLFGMVGVSNGMIKGNIDELVPTAVDDNTHKSPSFYLKAGIDKQVKPEFRVRASASFYTNNSSGGQTLYGGDRTGSNYFMVMEKPGGTYSANAFSGRFNPGFSKKVDALQVNGFIKARGLELFGTLESAQGRSKNETEIRDVSQYAVDAVYRFGSSENLFVGARYNTVSATLANVPATLTTEAIVYNNDVKISRMAFGGGWFMTKNILLKGEYVNQEYKDFPTADYRDGGRFKGFVVQAAVGF
ncbi:hypothetical protein TH61_10935 [Rufibacter sp. DG15C]|uniref:hypothetical protein n=1 Tax=Rufibacter sp. DG15C TaxID=1379909 RepID=UPI00078CBA3F|nr:hypothetical protein [Rufibacter sp. DG15C]AMM51586.1 hypothetical protein TH61_10935 [Rufibacter sp. DG15C]